MQFPALLKLLIVDSRARAGLRGAPCMLLQIMQPNPRSRRASCASVLPDQAACLIAQGSLPLSWGNGTLKGLDYLDLSRNAFTGMPEHVQYCMSCFAC